MRRVIALVLVMAMVLSCGITGAFAKTVPEYLGDSGVTDSGVTDSGKVNISVSAAPTASAVTEGDKLSTSKLTGGKVIVTGTTSEVSGKWAWTTGSTTVSETGAFEATFTPTPIDGKTFNPATLSKDVEVKVTAKPMDPSLKEAFDQANAAVTNMAVSNETTADSILAAIKAAITNDGVTAKWTKAFAKTAATAEKAGSVTGTIQLELSGGNLADVVINKVIAKLEPAQGLKVSVTYPNTNGYVSIDTKDTVKASDYFSVMVQDKEHNSYKISEVAISTNDKLSEVLKVSTGDYQDYRDRTPMRFIPVAGKALTDGVYNVAMTGVAKAPGKVDANITFNVELHIGNTDPAYFTVGKAIFNVADLDKPGAAITSETIVIKVPSGNAISQVVAAEPEIYTVKDGKWDSAKKEYSFKLEAKAAKDGTYDFNETTGIKATFGKQRMAYVPAEVEVTVRTTDTDIAKYLKLEPYEPLTIGGGTSIEVKPIEKLPDIASISGYVNKLINFVSTPADALYAGDSWVSAKKAGSASFDAEIDISLDGLFKVNANSLLYLAKGNKIATEGEETSTDKSNVCAASELNVNDLKTYKVTMNAHVYGKDGKAQEITKVEVTGKDVAYFKAPAELKADKNGGYTFVLELKNEVKELPVSTFFWLNYKLTTKEGSATLNNSINWSAGGAPKGIYFTKDGKKITEDTLSVGAAGTKYGVVIDGYKITAGDELRISGYSDFFTIVRGKIFYNDMGTNEQITVRMEKALPKYEQAPLNASLSYKPVITNKEVKWKIGEFTTITFNGNQVSLSSKGSTPVTKDALKKLTEDADKLVRSVSESANGTNIAKDKEWATKANRDTFVNAIKAGKAVVDNTKATQDEINKAFEALTAAQEKFLTQVSLGSGNGGNNNNGSTGGGSGSSGGGTGTPSVDKPSASVGGDGAVKADDIKNETSKAVADAVKANKGATANVTVKNAETITPEALKDMAAAATKAGGKVQLMADTVVNGVVESRLYINPAQAAALKAPISLKVATNSLEIDATKEKFAKFFDNNIAVASFAQQGAFGMKIEAAVKLDLTQLNTKTLKFYSYDKATNTYIPIVAPAYTIDKNGYLHFSTTVGGDILITDKPLTKKK